MMDFSPIILPMLGKKKSVGEAGNQVASADKTCDNQAQLRSIQIEYNMSDVYLNIAQLQTLQRKS